MDGWNDGKEAPQAPYIALSWTTDDGMAQVRAVASGLCRAGWRLTAEPSGLQLWTWLDRPPPVTLLARRDGVLLGRYIASAGSASNRSEPRAASAAAAALALSQDGWGAYVALLRDPATRCWWVMRDPSGAVEAYTWRSGPVAVLASGLADLPRGFLPPRVALDWTVVVDLLARPAAQTWRSPLQDVAAIAPGDLQPLGEPNRAAQAIWRPARHVGRKGAGASDPLWPEQLRATAMAAVEGLARPYSRLTTEVSGGLDSSIVNAALAQAGLQGRVVEALHYVGDRREGDERSWAAELCARYRLPYGSSPGEVRQTPPPRTSMTFAGSTSSSNPDP